VNEQVWGSLLSKIMMRLSEMKLGGSLELSSEMGPLSSKMHYNLITVSEFIQFSRIVLLTSL